MSARRRPISRATIQRKPYRRRADQRQMRLALVRGETAWARGKRRPVETVAHL